VTALVLVFDIKGEMALFRKPYTTTSMVSFPFPPPTAIAGILGAIVGLENGADEGGKSARYWHHLAGTQVTLAVRAPLRWIQTAVNLTNVKEPEKAPHIRVKQQLVKNPEYRVYVKGGELYGKLRERLEKRESVYTLCLGVAYALADVEYVGEFPESRDEEEAPVRSVLPIYDGVEVDVLKTGSLHRETVPYRFTTERRLVETVGVLYHDFQAKVPEGIYLRSKGEVETGLVGEERVAWFRAW